MNVKVIFLLLLLDAARAKIQDNVRVTESGCWEWTRSGDGRYGHVYLLGERFKAHVLSAILWKGWITRTRVLCHQCDNPACCNPEHLKRGTQARNRWEASERGRAAGLQVRQVARIRNLLTRGHDYTTVAARTGVHYTTVMRIDRGLMR